MRKWQQSRPYTVLSSNKVLQSELAFIENLPCAVCQQSCEIVLLVQSLSCIWLFLTLWTAACEASLSFTISWSLLKLMSIEPVMPSNHLILCHPLLSCLQSFPASGSFPMSQFFISDGQRIGASASTSVLPMNIQDGLLWSPCSLRYSQEPSPTPQFKSINSSALSFLYDPTVTSIHDYWKNHSLD